MLACNRCSPMLPGRFMRKGHNTPHGPIEEQPFQLSIVNHSGHSGQDGDEFITVCRQVPRRRSAFRFPKSRAGGDQAQATPCSSHQHVDVSLPAHPFHVAEPMNLFPRNSPWILVLSSVAIEELVFEESVQKQIASGCPTNDFLHSAIHLWSINSGATS